MTRPTERLIAIEGVNGGAMTTAARALITANRQKRAGVSAWDASGIFGEVLVADVGAGDPSARTLLLLYAADLAFRLRWEIRPALAAGRLVVAAPYVDTAIAFGRAAGIEQGWLVDMLSFAPRAAIRQYVDSAPARAHADRRGFVEFCCQQMLGGQAGAARLELLKHTGAMLHTMSRRSSDL